MKKQFTYTDNRQQKMTVTKVANDYLFSFGATGHRVQIPKDRLEYILKHLDEELVSGTQKDSK